MVPTFSDWQFPYFSSIFTFFRYFLKLKVNFVLKVWHHISMVFISSGWQISLTFPVFCQFSNIKISWFSSILGKISWLFQSDLIKIPRLFPDWKMDSYFSRLPRPSGNHGICIFHLLVVVSTQAYYYFLWLCYRAQVIVCQVSETISLIISYCRDMSHFMHRVNLHVSLSCLHCRREGFNITSIFTLTVNYFIMFSGTTIFQGFFY